MSIMQAMELIRQYLSNNLSFSSINLNGEVTYFLDHTSDPSGGNWITLGSPSERRRIQLPQPITITYSGPRSLKSWRVFRKPVLQ